MTPCPDVSLLWGSFTLHCSQIICVVLLFWWCHISKSQFIIIMVLFSLAVLSGFINHMYLQNRHKCIEPLQEPWLRSHMQNVSELLKTDWMEAEELSTNVWKCYELWTCPICWTVFIDAKIMSFSHSLLFWSIFLSWKDCITACLTAWSVVWFCILSDYSALY